MGDCGGGAQRQECSDPDPSSCQSHTNAALPQGHEGGGAPPLQAQPLVGQSECPHCVSKHPHQTPSGLTHFSRGSHHALCLKAWLPPNLPSVQAEGPALDWSSQSSSCTQPWLYALYRDGLGLGLPAGQVGPHLSLAVWTPPQPDPLSP